MLGDTLAHCERVARCMGKRRPLQADTPGCRRSDGPDCRNAAVLGSSDHADTLLETSTFAPASAVQGHSGSPCVMMIMMMMLTPVSSFPFVQQSECNQFSHLSVLHDYRKQPCSAKSGRTQPKFECARFEIHKQRVKNQPTSISEQVRL